MSHRALTLLLSGAIGMTLAGCAASPVMRAQNPQAGRENGWIAESCPSCQGAASAHCAYDSREFINLPFHPIHRNSYTYNVPRQLMYPPSPSQAGIYQYPYYTLRGPTDFFMK